MRKIGKKDLFVVGAVVVLVAVALSSGTSWAFNLGGGGSTTGSDLYKLIVTDFIQGPIGTAAGVAFIVVGAAMAVMGKITSAILAFTWRRYAGSF